MPLDLSWAHTTLSVWVLYAATLVASSLAFIAALLLETQGPNHDSLRPRLFGGITLILSAIVPIAISFMAAPLLVPGLASFSTASFCFGAPHTNMLVGVIIPPLSWLLAKRISSIRSKRLKSK